MNILILSNGAPKYYNFFNELAKRLSEEGHKIVFAVDCKYSLVENCIAQTGFPYYVFSEAFRERNCDVRVLRKFSDFNLNFALLSDFERSQVYKLGGRKSNEYFDDLKCALLEFFSRIVEEENIDLVFYENISNTFAYFCWFVCAKYNVRYKGFTPSRLPGRFWFTENPFDEHKKVDATFDKINKGEVEAPDWLRKWAGDYILGIDEVVPDYMRFNNLNNISIAKKYLNSEKFRKLIFSIKSLAVDGQGSFQRVSPLAMSYKMFLRSCKRKVRANRLSRFYELPVPGENYFLYPLHYHPESSTSILSGSYLDEYEVIRNIAFNLPEGTRLYVKDHSSAYGLPSLSFYEKLCRLPNVRLLSHKENTKKLIRGSLAVTTLTSTVGYESLLMNKKVLLFGSVFYQGHKNVVKVYDLEGLNSKLNELCSENGSEDSDDIFEYNVKFICAYYINTLKGTLNLMQDIDGARRLLDEVYPEVKRELSFSPSNVAGLSG
ncbi:hypothetical protein [Halomonas sp. MMSF_3323]|uniref:capsular polysaccharide export protein, LipB/KpsS family n=1 Tax=Halomonas sp. MMSF_3323 TaxID=3046701 RepID=UPI00273EED9A|nr:hypothetical protein [Halomonas sp. MMSF_3323]